MTDGFISEPSIYGILLEHPIASAMLASKEAIETHDSKRLAAVMPPHSYYDNALDSADLARFTGADTLGLSPTANIGGSSFLDPENIRIMNTSEKYLCGKFEITFFESRHAPLISDKKITGEVKKPFQIPALFAAWRQGPCHSILIKHPDGTVLVKGSAGFIPGHLDDVQAEVIFLGVGGIGQHDFEHIFDYVGAPVHAVQARRVYIVHHDDLFARFGQVEPSMFVPSFDQVSAFNLLQLVMLARLMQPSFGVPFNQKRLIIF